VGLQKEKLMSLQEKLVQMEEDFNNKVKQEQRKTIITYCQENADKTLDELRNEVTDATGSEVFGSFTLQELTGKRKASGNKRVKTEAVLVSLLDWTDNVSRPFTLKEAVEGTGYAPNQVRAALKSQSFAKEGHGRGTSYVRTDKEYVTETEGDAANVIDCSA
jgi:hypothetical protein